MIDHFNPTHLLQRFLREVWGLRDEIKFDIAANPSHFDEALTLAKTFYTRWSSASKNRKPCIFRQQ